jgi:lipopolysaccharide export LptBFGC system permease protein LptF
VFISGLAGIYISSVLFQRITGEKKWNFKFDKFSLFLTVVFSFVFANFADVLSDEYVKRKIQHEWVEKVVSTQIITDVVRSKEQEGSFFLGIGDIKQKETFRYSILNADGSINRDKLYATECEILKAQDGEQKVLLVKKIRIYKNPDEKKFYQNHHDETNGFYRVYLL